ncbi:MAG: hypothetical protein NVSMB3_02150 [Acidobacteriaceae bacterium]
MRGAVCAAAVAFASAGAAAQTGVYAEFTGGKVSTANTPWMYGPTIGLYHDDGFGPIALGLDVRGSFLRRGDTNGSGSSQSLNTLEGGVRLAITPHVLPIKPYVEALGGYGGLTAGQGSARTSASHFTYQFLGGVDLTFLPRLDWRVVELSYGRLSGLGDSYAPTTLSTGLVLRLP